MKKFSLSSVFIFLLVLLSSCGTSETPDIKTEVDSTISSGSKTGLDASGNIVPFGTPGVISTQIPEGVVMIKKEYTLSNGTKELLQ